jgi:diaminopimelate epimerase
MAGVPFAKMTGAGNDFILIDDTTGVLADADLPALARGLCRRSFSVGADGLIVVRRSRVADFGWRFFNADGSEAEMCGNGGRCAARFAHLKGIAGPDLSFETLAGIVRASVQGESVILGMTEPTDLRKPETLEVEGRPLEVWFVNTGVPHAVVFLEDLLSLDVERLGRAIRRHPRYAPAGTNADFVRVRSQSSIEMRVYERGVEAETLACGTGAVACAVAAAHRGLAWPPVSVKTWGGAVLRVHFEKAEDLFRKVFLEGDARLICEGEYGREALYPEAGPGDEGSE